MKGRQLRQNDILLHDHTQKNGLRAHERRNTKPSAIPVQYVPYHSLDHRRVCQTSGGAAEAKNENTGTERCRLVKMPSADIFEWCLIFVNIGTCTDGEFYTLRSEGEHRPEHLYHMIQEARSSASKMSESILISLPKAWWVFISILSLCSFKHVLFFISIIMQMQMDMRFPMTLYQCRFCWGFMNPEILEKQSMKSVKCSCHQASHHFHSGKEQPRALSMKCDQSLQHLSSFTQSYITE